MGWFNRKPRDLIADSIAEADLERLEYARLHKNLDGLLAHEDDSHGARGMPGQEFQNLVAAGGWCAPSSVNYGFLDLPEIQVRRGGVR